MATFGYKGKRSFKLSLIVDVNGIPLSVLVKPANENDAILGAINLKKSLIDLKYNITNYNNKTKRYLLADSIYYTNDFMDNVKSLNINPIIYPNKKNTKDPELIKNMKLNKTQKKIYKKRTIIENGFSWNYKNKRIKNFNEKDYNNYYSFLYISFLKLILRRLD